MTVDARDMIHGGWGCTGPPRVYMINAVCMINGRGVGGRGGRTVRRRPCRRSTSASPRRARCSASLGARSRRSGRWRAGAARSRSSRRARSAGTCAATPSRARPMARQSSHPSGLPGTATSGSVRRCSHSSPPGGVSRSAWPVAAPSPKATSMASSWSSRSMTPSSTSAGTLPDAVDRRRPRCARPGAWPPAAAGTPAWGSPTARRWYPAAPTPSGRPARPTSAGPRRRPSGCRRPTPRRASAARRRPRAAARGPAAGRPARGRGRAPAAAARAGQRRALQQQRRGHDAERGDDAAPAAARPVVRGSAKPAASVTTPLIPAHDSTTTFCHGGLAPSRRSQGSRGQVDGGEHPQHPDDDHGHGHGQAEHEDVRLSTELARACSSRLELQADQQEDEFSRMNCTVRHSVRSVTRDPADWISGDLWPRISPATTTASTPTRQLLRGEVGDVGHEQRQRGVERRVLDPAAHGRTRPRRARPTRRRRRWRARSPRPARAPRRAGDAASAVRKVTSAVASLSRLSPSRMVTIRRGMPDPAGHGGRGDRVGRATTAPSATAAASE